MRGCGALSFPGDMVLNAVTFWAQNSYEHIDVLLNSGSTPGAQLYPYFKEELEKLFKGFKEIYAESKKEKHQFPKQLVRNFIETNHYFIRLLERLKFEGFNGIPMLMEVTYHFLYEQQYVDQIFMATVPSVYHPPKDVVIHAIFRKNGLGSNPLDCIYGQMYFWSLIGAEHCSILTANLENQLPKDTLQQYYKFRNDFNDLNYKLSQIYEDMKPAELSKVFLEFKKVNTQFLAFLKEYKENKEVFPQKVRESLPDLYFGVLQHIIDEHAYVLSLCKEMGEVLGYKKNK